MAIERGRTIDPREMFSTLSGRVPDGVIIRAMEFGGIPDSGPGSHSIPNALKGARCAEFSPTTRVQRRAWNQANKTR